MKLITEVDLPAFPFSLDHRRGILMLGSCFTDIMGKKLERYLFPVNLNPFGTIFNPLSILNGLKALRDRETYGTDDLHNKGGLWYSFEHYTGFSAPDSDQCLENINAAFKPAKKAFEEAGTLILSWGSSWIYTHRESGKIVANCHKIPAREFERRRLSPKEIFQLYSAFLREILPHRPGLKILLTISPVRHWKDGAHGNQLSKASLLLAGEMLTQEFPESVFYFPSYEIVMDELRDYRFYAPDMLHTSELASSIIWQKLCSALVSGESRQIISELEPLLKFREHRPRKRGTEYEEAVKKMMKREEDLKIKYPYIIWYNMPPVQ